MKKLLYFMDKVFELIAVLGIITMVSLVFFNAVLRYFFAASLPATEELSRFAFIWICNVGIIVAARANAHVSVNIVTDALKGIPALIVRILREAIILGVMGVVLYGSYVFTTFSNFLTPATQTPFHFITISLVIMSGSVMLIYVTRSIADIVTYTRTGKTGPDKPEENK